MPKKELQPYVIETAKTFEKPEDVVLFMHDLDAFKVMQSWRIHHPAFADRRLKPYEDPLAALAALWDDVTPDFVKISNAAKLPMNAAVETFNRLRESRIVYPDGTVHKNVFETLRAEIGMYIKSLIPT